MSEMSYEIEKKPVGTEGKSTPAECKNIIKKLMGLRMYEKLDFSLKVATPDCENGDGKSCKPCFEKQIKSDGEYSFVKVVTFIAIVGMTISLMCTVCSMLKFFKK